MSRKLNINGMLVAAIFVGRFKANDDGLWYSVYSVTINGTPDLVCKRYRPRK